MIELKRIFISLVSFFLKHKYWTDLDMASNGVIKICGIIETVNSKSCVSEGESGA